MRLTEKRNGSGIRRDDVEDHPDGGRLARAVRAEEPVHRTARDLKRQITNRDVRFVALRHASYVDGEIHEWGSGGGAGLLSAPEFTTPRTGGRGRGSLRDESRRVSPA